MINFEKEYNNLLREYIKLQQKVREIKTCQECGAKITLVCCPDCGSENIK